VTDPFDATAAGRLERSLEEQPALLPFAEAVVRHLVGPPSERLPVEEVIETVSHTLRDVVSGNSEAAVQTLLDDPQLLASFFQNADLLAPRGPEARAVTQTVMRAVGRRWDQSA
jgi:hypothetical protein